MNIPSDYVIQIGWKLAVAMIAGIPVLTTIAVWLLARFTSAFDAYSGERAKLLAQFHNIDKLVEQNKLLTTNTESIKAELSGEAWLRQQRWAKRFDAYVSFIDRLGHYRYAVIRVILYLKARMSTSSVPLGDTEDIYNTALVSLHHAIAMAAVSCDKEAADISGRVSRSIGRFTSITDFEALRDVLSAELTEFVHVARRDLGYD